jgi:hypothetical protein
MKYRLIRLALSLICPPVFASLLMYGYNLATNPQQSHGWPNVITDHLMWIAIFIGYGMVFCLIPGLIYWAISEALWKYGNRTIHNRIVYSIIGAALGVGAGALIAQLFINRNLTPATWYLMTLSGAGAGFLTSWIVHSKYKKIA